MNTDSWNNIRREAEITSVEFADYAGISRKHALLLETGRIVPTKADFDTLMAMIRKPK